MKLQFCILIELRVSFFKVFAPTVPYTTSKSMLYCMSTACGGGASAPPAFYNLKVLFIWSFFPSCHRDQ